MRIPQISSIETAVLMYYEKLTLGTKDVQVLFGCSPAVAYKLKEMCGGGRNVNTDDAYDAWGIDIDALEIRLKKIKELKGGA